MLLQIKAYLLRIYKIQQLNIACLDSYQRYINFQIDYLKINNKRNETDMSEEYFHGHGFQQEPLPL